MAERLASAAALMTLVLTAIGIYCTVSHAVSQRNQEFGVRLAIGAQRGHIAVLVARQLVAPAVVGLLAGLGGAAAMATLSRQELFGIAPLDPWTYGVGAVLVVAAALLACVLPARRASNIDPVTSLRGA
jgi:ABC-type antimicrobial peptide transport system permease subunit